MNVIARIISGKKPAAGGKLLFWTALSGGTYAASSFVCLIIVTQYLGAHLGGIFSIALAVSQQMITIGWFNTRKYQVSDTFEKYRFCDYVNARIVTVVLMLTAGLAWIVTDDFSYEKRIAALLLIALKASEAFSDVFAGRYQQKDRFDIACRILFTKTAATIVVFFFVVAVSSNLNAALFSMLVTHIALTVITDGYVLPDFKGPAFSFSFKKTSFLLAACLPLFINSFLQMYLNNAPKYAVDSFCNERDLAAYNVLSMISFVVALLADFVINPQIAKVSEAYNSGNKSRFARVLIMQGVIVIIIGIIGLILAKIFAIPVLSFCFGFDLGDNSNTVCVLLIAGILLALYQIFQLILIVMRKQTWCLLGIIIASVSAYCSSSIFVQKYGIIGGAFSYLISMAILLVTFASLSVIFLHRTERPKICD